MADNFPLTPGWGAQMIFPCTPLHGQIGTGWAPSQSGMVAPATNNPQAIWLPMPAYCHGHMLRSVDVIMKVQGPHSALPAAMPAFSIIMSDLRAPFFSSWGGFSPAPANAAAWDDGGAVQVFNVPVSPGVVFPGPGPGPYPAIDTYSCLFALLIVDEHGAGAVAGNTYYGVRVYHDFVGAGIANGTAP